MPKTSNNLVGVTGEYFVCAELGKRGVLALLTPKNNPLFDIVAIAADASKTVTIQVKTMSEQNKQGWKLSKQIIEKKNIKSLFIILVDLKSDSICDFYIYKYDDFVSRVNKIYDKYISVPNSKTGEPKKDVDFRWFNYVDFEKSDHLRKNNWNTLGF